MSRTFFCAVLLLLLPSIAQAADVTEPVLYRHFDDKKALFLEVLREIRETALLSWQGEVARQADPLAKLHAIASAYLVSTREQAPEFRVLHHSLLETQDAEVASFLRLSIWTVRLC